MRRKTHPYFKHLFKIWANPVYPILAEKVHIRERTGALLPFISVYHQDTEFYAVVGWQRHLSKISGEEKGGTYFISQLMTHLKENDNENMLSKV